MKTVNITLSYEEMHAQICDLCAAYDWLQQVNPSTGVRYPLITRDMLTLLQPQYLKLIELAASVLRGWISYTDDDELGYTLAMSIPPHVSERDVKTLLESYVVDSTLRKYSHIGGKNYAKADETLYLLAGMLTPEEDYADF